MRTIFNNVILLAFLFSSFMLMSSECEGQTKSRIFYVEQIAYAAELPPYQRCLKECEGSGRSQAICEQECYDKFSNIGEARALIGTVVQPDPPNPCDTGNCPEMMELLRRIRIFRPNPVRIRLMAGKEVLAQAESKGSSRNKPLDFKVRNEKFQGEAMLVVEIEGYGTYEMPVNIGKMVRLKGTHQMPANQLKNKEIRTKVGKTRTID